MTHPLDAPTPAWRPAFHYTPAAHWMNDPNGLVFHDGVYHLHYQHHPHGLRWGPMHWGHASSTDLLHWQEHPIALAPDARGMCFSGSAVVDARNTSGLGRDGQAPWVAMFTRHDDDEARRGGTRFQTQDLAFSLDGGATWQPHAGNPVIDNPGLRDFRDPKLAWHAPSGRWIMVLAAGDHVRFYASPDLQAWDETGRFATDALPAGTLWECPDLVALPLAGRLRWVLIVSVVTGAPNGGSGTLYFVGDFDGRRFAADDPAPRWLDHGPDDYAGITWAHAGERALFIGWMANWAYAQDLPTAPWRGAMTLPRELSLHDVAGTPHLASLPPGEVSSFGGTAPRLHAVPAGGKLVLDAELHDAGGAMSLAFRMDASQGFELELSNGAGDRLLASYRPDVRRFAVDRTHTGVTGFHAGFAGCHTAPRLLDTPAGDVLMVLDRGSLELFADGGLSVLTGLHFPRAPWRRMRLRLPGALASNSASTWTWPGPSGPGAASA